jgi:hypothetical protein
MEAFTGCSRNRWQRHGSVCESDAGKTLGVPGGGSRSSCRAQCVFFVESLGSSKFWIGELDDFHQLSVNSATDPSTGGKGRSHDRSKARFLLRMEPRSWPCDFRRAAAIPTERLCRDVTCERRHTLQFHCRRAGKLAAALAQCSRTSKNLGAPRKIDTRGRRNGISYAVIAVALAIASVEKLNRKPPCAYAGRATRRKTLHSISDRAARRCLSPLA